MAIYAVTVDLSGWTGGPGTNTLYFNGKGQAGGVGSQGAADAAASLAATFMVGLRPVISAGVTMQVRNLVTARDPINGAAIAQFGVTQPATTGLSAGDRLPPANALVIGWQTTLPTRQGRGRSFIGPTGEGNNESNGTPSAVTLSDAQSAANTLISNSAADPSAEFVIWHRPTPLLPASGVARVVTTAKIRDLWGVLRSRRD